MAYDDITPIVIILGRDGIWAKRNKNLVPIGSFRTLRNATLEDESVRAMGGATSLGSAPVASKGLAAIDYFPVLGTQRTLVSFADGSLRKDDGNGASWTTLASGLTTAGQVPMWTIGGAESAGRDKKAFHCDRVNAVRVLAADAATASAIASPPADWTGANQPGWMAPHDGAIWGGGNANGPKQVYKSLRTNHEDFLTFPYSKYLAGEFERTVAGLSYKGGLLVFCYPKYTFWIDTRPLDENAWSVAQVSEAGAAGPGNVAAVEDDVLWVSPDGSWHLISATQATGSVRSSNIAYRKLGTYVPEKINLAQLATAQLIFYAHKQVAMLACHAAGGTVKNRRIDFDVNRRHDPEVGERWLFQDRDTNEALFLRKEDEILIPAMVDSAGLVWELDRTARTKDGALYTTEWELNDKDFSELLPMWAGRKKNGRYLQLEYDPRSTVEHTLEIYRDGSKKQTMQFTFTGGPTTLPVTLPVTLADAVLTATPKKQLYGQAVRWGFRGTFNGDASPTRMLVGLEAAG